MSGLQDPEDPEAEDGFNPTLGELARVEFGLRCERALLQLTMHGLELLRARGTESDARTQVERTAAVVHHQLAVVECEPPEYRPMMVLARRLDLTPSEIEFAWMVVAQAAQPGIRRSLPGDAVESGITPDVFARVALFPDVAAARSFALRLRTSSLVTSGLLRPRGKDRGLSTSYTAAPALLLHLLGEFTSDERFHLAFPLDDDRFVADDAQAATIAQLAAWRSHRTLILVEGPEGSGRRTAIAYAMQQVTHTVDLHGMTDAVALRALLLDFQAHLTIVGGTAVLLNLHMLWNTTPDSSAALREVAAFIDRLERPVFAPVRAITGSVPGRYAALRTRWPKPSPEGRGGLWRSLAAAHRVAVADDVIDRLARRYPVGSRVMSQAVETARSQAVAAGEDHERPRLSEQVVTAALRGKRAEQIADLGSFVEVRHDWDDLVLPPGTRDQIDLVIARVENAERVLGTWGFGDKLAGTAGTVVLLSGGPGTGKTLSAGLISRALGYELFAIDLSQVLSKWIGETEQRLARLFEAAEMGHLALLIDEAEALFGRRAVQVTTANDRYSNMEIDYLLQRLDRFSGVAFLTTNQPELLDPAMQRRFAAHISVPVPGDRERAQLWRRMLATGRSPIAADVDPDDLARRFPEMTGGNIRNAVLAAAFFAAAAPADAIAHAHAVRGARVEYEAMGRAPRPSLRTVPPEE